MRDHTVEKKALGFQHNKSGSPSTAPKSHGVMPYVPSYVAYQKYKKQSKQLYDGQQIKPGKTDQTSSQNLLQPQPT